MHRKRVDQDTHPTLDKKKWKKKTGTRDTSRSPRLTDGVHKEEKTEPLTPERVCVTV